MTDENKDFSAENENPESEVCIYRHEILKTLFAAPSGKNLLGVFRAFVYRRFFSLCIRTAFPFLRSSRHYGFCHSHLFIRRVLHNRKSCFKSACGRIAFDLLFGFQFRFAQIAP